MVQRKKVLIVTYYWPPAGGIATLRCLKIAKYLREFGWEPIIYTAKNAHYPFVDHSNDKDIPEGVEILRGRIWEPYYIYKFITGQKPDADVNNVFYVKSKGLGVMHKLSVWIRSNFFIPDARKCWIRPSVRLLRRYLHENPVDALFSDGPPHTNTRICTLLSKEFNIPWLADFQDPWTQVDYYSLLRLTRWGDRKHRRMEQEAFQTAKAMTIVSPTWKRDLESIGADNVHVIPWGFDPEDYDDLEIELRTMFCFTHVGIMGYDRLPGRFFRVLSDLCTADARFASHLEVMLVGQVDHTVRKSYRNTPMESKIHLVGSVPRSKALAMTAASPVLLLLLNQQENASGRIPGKLFEYLAVRRPILCLGPPDSDVENIIRKTGSGYYHTYDDYDGMKKTVRLLYRQFREGTLQSEVNSEIGKYSARTLTGKVAAILDRISTH